MSHADKVIEAIKAMTPEERVQSLISAGIIREDGTLMPQYGGTSTSGDIPTPETDAAEKKLRKWLIRAHEADRRGSHLDSDDPRPDDGFTVARDLERRLAAATARAEEAEHLANSQANLLCNINDTLRSRGFPGEFATDIRVIKMAQALDDGLRASAELERLRKEWEWQPIETAPKDGSYILVTNPQSAGVWVAMYEEVFQSGYKPENPWRSMMLNHNHISTRHASTKPTHWMPLPAAPKQEEG